MIDLSSYKDYLSEKAHHLLTIAIEESRKRQHFYLGVEHIFLAFVKTERGLFEEIMQESNIEPNHMINYLNDHLNESHQYLGVGMKIPPATKTIFKVAWEEAQRLGRKMIEPIDLFAAVFHETDGIPVKIVRDFGVDPNFLLSKIVTKAKLLEKQVEELKKKYELPSHLKYLGVNLNKLAREGKLHSVIGRDKEIEQMLEILSHKERANSVMVLGEAGVGKTALVEGLAMKLEYEPDAIPPRLRNYQIVNLQMNTVVAGTIFRGMFEDRMEKIINEVKERKNLILFVDEAHNIIGAGSAMGVPADAANIFKSSLARGEVQIIGATTPSEYKEFIQDDEALARRFRLVNIQEPSCDETREILFGLRSRLERNYSVSITDDAIETAITMSPRYMRNLRLPDKAISWLDTASVKVEINRPDDVVREEDIIQVISQEGRVPIDMVFRDTTGRFKEMENALAKRVVGQKEALKSIAKHMRLNKGQIGRAHV